MTSKIKSWALWGTGLGTAALIAGASVYLDLPQGAHAAPATAAAAPAVPVTVATVEPRNVSTWQEFSGRLKPSTASRSGRASPAPSRRCISAKADW